MSPRATRRAASVLAIALMVGGCGDAGRSSGGHHVTPSSTGAHAGIGLSVPVAGTIPAPLDPRDVYAADRPGQLSPVVRNDPSLIYVPNSESNTVSVIDPRRHRVIRTFPVGALPQHVVPSWDLNTLWVTNDAGNSLTPINPRTGNPGKPVPVEDPYNMYFTPDGRYAVVVAERLQRLDFRDPHTMRLHHSLPLQCEGVDHADFTADGRTMLASCEFSGKLAIVDVARQQVIRYIWLPPGSSPQDVKLSPDGRLFYVADKAYGGIYEIDARTFRRRGFIHTGNDAHGLYVGRDSRYLYVTNRQAGTVSVVSFASRRVTRTWRIPGGTPDMGGFSADGNVLWLSGRYHGEVYALSTQTGRLLARIRVGLQPHGLCVFPQPGRYSLGHTGVFR